MSTTRVRADSDRQLSRLGRMGLVAVLIGVAGVCWVLTVARMSGMSTDGMGAGPGTELSGLGRFSLTWAVMMTAMMLPSLAPAVVTYASVQQTRTSRMRTTPPGTTVVFIAGYLISWIAAGVVGYLVVEEIRLLGIGFPAWNQAGRYLAGTAIVGAALYQLTGLKGVCLRHCRNPELLVRHWRSGRLAALRIGLEHGGFCIGSCWALMAVLAVLGLMSLGWMAFVAALVALEKLLPSKALASHAVALSLVVLGLAVAFAAAR